MTTDLKYGDCLEQMDTIADSSVDMVLCDLPYGCLNASNPSAHWDSVIPIEPLWTQYLRVCKPNAAIVLFAQGLFSAKLMLSKPDLYRYSLVWDKVRVSGFLNANRMPLRSHEDILVFYRELPTYNPQIRDAPIGYETHSKGRVDKDMTNSCYGDFHMTEDCDLTKKYPKSIITVPREPPTEIVHPTQKPIELCEWLINSYTNEGETVLDNTMGSGTTGIACVRTNRNFIGIEKDEKWFGVAQKRIEKQRESGVQLRLFT